MDKSDNQILLPVERQIRFRLASYCDQEETLSPGGSKQIISLKCYFTHSLQVYKLAFYFDSKRKTFIVLKTSV